MVQKFINAGRYELLSAVSSTDTTINLLSSAGLPVANVGTGPLSAGDWFRLVLQDTNGIEVVIVRTRATGSDQLLNVLRGQEGTTARAWNSGTVIGNRWTAADAAGVLAADLSNTQLQNAPDGADAIPASRSGSAIRFTLDKIGEWLTKWTWTWKNLQIFKNSASSLVLLERETQSGVGGFGMLRFHPNNSLFDDAVICVATPAGDKAVIYANGAAFFAGAVASSSAATAPEHFVRLYDLQQQLANKVVNITAINAYTHTNNIPLGVRTTFETSNPAAMGLPTSIGGANSWVVDCYGSTGRAVQTAIFVFNFAAGRLFVRTLHDFTWSAWTEKT
ncbi:hypothetical protein [Comamonas sp.]|uniref:hypothetical protein n=1 Tax=Comamonas sp. TaxID=34028 RepID=UPI00289B5D79|nr:hypothetical protein [Comamonas sp.]